MRKVTITEEHLQSLYSHKILPRYNAGPPTGGRYGWISAGTEIELGKGIRIEENVALYGGPYKPFRGGRSTHGFATVGAFSSCASPLPEDIIVGRYCEISTGFRIIDSAHPLNTLTMSAGMFRPHNKLYQRMRTPATLVHAKRFDHTPSKYPIIANDVWIGANVTMSPHITVGTGAMIASGSMVTKDVPPYAIVGGNPARLIRYRFDPEQIARLLSSAWWNYDPQQLFQDDPADIASILDRVESGQLDLYAPEAFTFL